MTDNHSQSLHIKQTYPFFDMLNGVEVCHCTICDIVEWTVNVCSGMLMELLTEG